MATPTESTRFPCSICSKTFSRKDHQQRHILSHEANKPFSCPLCLAEFGRKDTLLRHVRLHAAGDSTDGSQLPRTAIACENCVVMKVRCSDQKPCTSCVRLELECVPREGQNSGGSRQRSGSENEQHQSTRPNNQQWENS